MQKLTHLPGSSSWMFYLFKCIPLPHFLYIAQPIAFTTTLVLPKYNRTLLIIIVFSSRHCEVNKCQIQYTEIKLVLKFNYKYV